MGRLVFLQLLGTAMGTSAACMWATIYVTVREMGKIMPRHGKHLPLMLRFKDDINKIWVGDPRGMEWKEFKKDVSKVGTLTWTFEERAFKGGQFLGLNNIDIGKQDRYKNLSEGVDFVSIHWLPVQPPSKDDTGNNLQLVEKLQNKNRTHGRRITLRWQSFSSDATLSGDGTAPELRSTASIRI